MNFKLLRRLDPPLILSVVAILALSLPVLWSASGSISANQMSFLSRQLLFIGLGVALLSVTLGWDYGQLGRYSWYLYWLNLVLLALVLVAGTMVHGSRSWFNLGPFLLQPSEIAKVILIITLADFLSKRDEPIERLRDLVPVFAFVGLPMVFILLQPDLGTASVFLAVLLGMLFVAGTKASLMAWVFGGGFLAVVLVLVAHFRWGLPVPLDEYQLMRLVVFIDPYADGANGQGAGYQVIQSLVAVGSGGLWGSGLNKGSQAQLDFLPERHTDFIFSVLGEEMGFFAAAGLLCLYLLFLYRCLKVSYEARDSFGALLVSGVVSMVAFHVLVNVGMTIGVMPITGIPLPFFSYGGSSMVTNMLALGLVLNVNMRRHKIVF